MHAHSTMCAQMFSQTKIQHEKICTKIKPTDTQNKGEDTSTHSAYTYNHGEKSLSHNFTAVLSDTYTRSHASTHTIDIVVISHLGGLASGNPQCHKQSDS